MLTWLEEPYRPHYDALIREIRQGNCVAFLGAGLSKNARYPLWRELLKRLVEEAKLGDTVPEEPDISAYLEIAEKCQNKLGERYYNLLEEIFKASNKEHFLPSHIYLHKIPFIAYVTTNYDLCLLKAAAQLDGHLRVRIHPDLDPVLLGQTPRTIFHIHGVAFGVNGEPLVRSIILTTTQYNQAYHNSESIKNLLYASFCYKTVLFVAFGLSEQDVFLPEILNAARKDYNHRQRAFQERGQGNLPPKEHYIIRPMYFTTDSTTGETKRNMDREKWEEEDLHRLGICTIRYEADESHSRLPQIIKDIMDETSPSKVAQAPYTPRRLYMDRS